MVVCLFPLILQISRTKEPLNCMSRHSALHWSVVVPGTEAQPFHFKPLTQSDVHVHHFDIKDVWNTLSLLHIRHPPGSEITPILAV